ncbi:hypothetical protein CPLU01_07292 [Colletotrichum plurivorum]|uniref:Uncharacterized protein n=1 Tax=Colletotrichum plurivorum TaxID=2175906 RepID=A0A8H6NF24_9PEZI|nr:hypothetical protein CPLU01_07292 [Colletotrichum plurivorum]
MVRHGNANDKREEEEEEGPTEAVGKRYVPAGWSAAGNALPVRLVSGLPPSNLEVLWCWVLRSPPLSFDRVDSCHSPAGRLGWGLDRYRDDTMLRNETQTDRPTDNWVRAQLNLDDSRLRTHLLSLDEYYYLYCMLS